MAVPGFRLACAIGVVAGALLTSTAGAQLADPFGRNAVKMAPEDREKMLGAMREALEMYKPGASATWKAEKSDLAGVAVVTDTFERDGMKCAEMTHSFTSGQGRNYSAPLCKVADGSWKLAF